MDYFEARGSGKPFNRKKYKDDWYIYDQRRNIDFSRIDLSQRFWTSDDLNADDWWTVEMHNAELGMSDQDKEGFRKYMLDNPSIYFGMAEWEIETDWVIWNAACSYKERSLRDGSRMKQMNDEIENLKTKLTCVKNDYWFMINLIERYSSDKDQTLKDCLERMKFRGPMFKGLGEG